MAGTTGKRSRAASIQKQAIDQVNVSLQELPEKPKDNLSLREAVNQLQDEIRAALAKGYSYEDLAAMFSEKGIDISALTLKRYVSSGRSRTNKSTATRTRRPRKSKEEAVDSSPPAESTASTATAAKGRRGGAAAKTRATKATTTTAEPEKTTRGRAKATSTTAKPASTRRKRAAK